MTNKSKKIPHLGKLSIAILESHLKNIVGGEAIKELRVPLEEAKLKKTLEDTLVQTENRFVSEYQDKELCQAILQLPIANLLSLQEAIRKFYDRPTDPALEKTLRNQLRKDFSNLESDSINLAVKEYMKILREELVSNDDKISKKLVALEILGIGKNIGHIMEGEILYKKFTKVSELSQNIRVHEFQTLISNRTQNFIGRDFVFKKIDNIINDPEFPSGYVVISGEPGIGKTSLMAQLVKVGGFVHHFNIALQNIRSAQDFLSNICAQLIIRFELNHSSLPNNATKDSGFFVQLLAEASEKYPNDHIIVLIDALDEAEDSGPVSNRLYLPPSLPNRVFIITTIRSKAEYYLQVDNRKDIFIHDKDINNSKDIRNFIISFIAENNKKMTGVINHWGIDESKFIEILTQKSEGNFMYLVHVLGDIRDERLNADKLNSIHDLPVGLREYYQRHWRAMRDIDKNNFEKYQKPIICILATAREPVTIEKVSEWIELPQSSIKTTINEWMEFLNEDRQINGELTYRIYHTSFQDFLRDEIGLDTYRTLIVDKAFSKIKWPKNFKKS